MATTANGIVYPVAGDFVAPLNTHFQDLAESVQSAINTKVTYTPTFTGLTLGNGTVSATYVKVGGVIVDEIVITFGSTTAVTSEIYINGLQASNNTTEWMQCGAANLFNGTSYLGVALTNSATSVRILAQNAGGAFLAWHGLSSTTPFTWTTGNKIMVNTVRIAA